MDGDIRVGRLQFGVSWPATQRSAPSRRNSRPPVPPAFPRAPNRLRFLNRFGTNRNRHQCLGSRVARPQPRTPQPVRFSALSVSQSGRRCPARDRTGPPRLLWEGDWGAASHRICADCAEPTL